MKQRLTGKVTLVSGSARGTSTAYLRALAAECESGMVGDILGEDERALAPKHGDISSTEGMAGSIASHGYTATKFAVRGLTMSTALKLDPSGIRVNSIHPGLIRTPLAEWIHQHFFQTDLGRAGTPSEIASSVAYLASEELSYFIGSELVVNDGCTTGLGPKDFSAAQVGQQPEWIR